MAARPQPHATTLAMTMGTTIIPSLHRKHVAVKHVRSQMTCFGGAGTVERTFWTMTCSPPREDVTKKGYSTPYFVKSGEHQKQAIGSFRSEVSCLAETDGIPTKNKRWNRLTVTKLVYSDSSCVGVDSCFDLNSQMMLE